MTKPSLTVPAAMIAASLVAAGFAASAAQAAPREHVVIMANMKFGKLPADAKVGDTILWVNRDTVPHTATARNKSFDVRTGAGQRARTKLTRAGVIPIYCIYHPAMRATLRVSQ